MRLAAAGFVGSAAAQWFEQLAAFGAESPKRHRSCILLWMNGGPSQMDTFDLKPNTTHGGPFQEIATSVPGIRISEHLPRIAKQVHNLSIVRSMSTKEGDHSRATQFVHTGYPIQGPIAYPTLGSLISKELNRPDSELPGFVSIAPYRALSPGCLFFGIPRSALRATTGRR
jgi:hypothetical protein